MNKVRKGRITIVITALFLSLSTAFAAQDVDPELQELRDEVSRQRAEIGRQTAELEQWQSSALAHECESVATSRQNR